MINIMRLPGSSATNFAKGYLLADNGTIEQAAKQACIYDGVSKIWWRLVRQRVFRLLKANDGSWEVLP